MDTNLSNLCYLETKFIEQRLLTHMSWSNLFIVDCVCVCPLHKLHDHKSMAQGEMLLEVGEREDMANYVIVAEEACGVYN